jgi:GNAT superfamily N-acetyltransferase
MIAIKKLTGDDLISFIESSSFEKLENIPISKHRAWSHYHNPHRDKADIILYLAYLKNELVGYRTIMPGLLKGKKGTPLKVGWLSGNWVHPGKRRKGIASLLLDEALSDWGSMLLYTNYAPLSKAVYDKSELFTVYKSHEGVRLYTRSALAVILPPKKNIFRKFKFLLRLIDFILDIFLVIPRVIIKAKYGLKNCKYGYLAFPDKLVHGYMDKHNRGELESRGKEAFDWIVHHPWVINTPMQDPVNQKYHFSSTARKFNLWHLKIMGSDGTIKGYMLLSRKDAYFHVQYFHVDPGYIEIAMRIIIQHFLKCGCHILTVYNPLVVKSIKKYMGKWFPRKKIYRKYIVTKKLASELPEPGSQVFQDGAGDVVFV